MRSCSTPCARPINWVPAGSPYPCYGRLKKLGINKTDPNELTPDERKRFARLDIDADNITFRRVVDTNDRLLRTITVGQGPEEAGNERQTGFDITVASEIMAILALTKDLADMRDRMGNIVIGTSKAGEAITAEDLGVAGAIDRPDEGCHHAQPDASHWKGTPVFVHAGPFCQHCPRAELDHRRQNRPEAGGLRGD